MQVNFNELSFDQSNGDKGQSGPGVKFFNLANDGDEAIVRFMHDSVDSFDILSAHPITIDGKYKKVNCIRNANDPFDKCPMCAAKMPQNQRIFIHLLKYEKNEQGVNVPVPMVWERSLNYARDLKGKLEDYGPLSTVLFKVKRHGKKGDMTTSYSIDFANPAVYKPELYPIDGSAFENYKALGVVVMNKTFEEMASYVSTGSFPAVATQQTNTQQAAPQYQAPPAPQYTAPAQQQYAPPAAPAYQAPAQPQYNAPPMMDKAPWETGAPAQPSGTQRPQRYY